MCEGENGMKIVLFRTALLLTLCVLANGQTTFTNSAAITGTNAPANTTSLYPSNITVSGMSGTISKVTVRLRGFTHTVPADLDILLVGPAGQKFVIMSDAGRAVSVSGINFTLDDAAATRLPNATDATPGPIANNGVFRPASDDPTSDVFPAPAPAIPYNHPAPASTATFGSVFNGASPNGTWALFVADDVPGDNWNIANGWELTITTAVAAAPTATVLTSSLNPSFTAAPNNGVTFTATVTSSGSPVTVGSVTFRADGVQIGSPALVNGSGAATVNTAFTTEGVKNITATYNGTASFAQSSGSLSQTVNNHTSSPSANTFCNAGPISIAASQVVNPYPERIFVSGLAGTISQVSMQLPGFSANAPNGIDLLLVSPNGAKFIPMSDVGGALPASGITLTLSDTAAAALPQSGALSNGAFRPANFAPAAETDTFPAPAPPAPYLHAAPTGAATFASAFGGGNPNGEWRLFVVSDTPGDTGSINGYCLTITTSADAGTTTTVTSSQNPSLRNSAVTFTATVRRSDNNALVTSGTVTFTEGSTLLAGPITLNASGQAAFTTSTLNEGAHQITATFSGVPGSVGTSFGSISQQVDNPTEVSGLSYCNNGITTLPANGSPQPYGQRILVAGLSGSIDNLTVTLRNLTHAVPDDWEFLLVGPAGQKYVLMADSGGNTAISGVNLVLDDNGPPLPNGGPLVSGTFRPAVYEAFAFPSPAPPSPYAIPPTTLGATFGGSDPNGYWTLFVNDDVPGDISSVGGYCVNFTLTPPDLSITKSHSGDFRQGQQNVSYTIRVANTGAGGTQGVVRVDDTLPPGLTAASMAGSGWTCTTAPLRCERSDALAAGASYPDITLTVNVSPTAPSSVTNTATVSGGGDTTSGNNTATDPTTIVAASDLTVTKSHSGDFTQGQTGTYTITVRNSGAGPTQGTVTVADNLPAGLTAQSISGAGWTCSLATLSCTRSDVLAGSTNHPAITLVVNVIAVAGTTVINQAVVTGGAELDNTNNTANDSTNIVAGSINVSVGTNIAGLTFTVDGTDFTTAQSFSWTPNSSHTLSTTTPQGSGDTRYVFQNWSDGGAISHSVAPASPTSFTANFSTQFLLTTVANPVVSGTVTPSGFFDANSNVNLTATPAACFTFGSWSANANGGAVNMSAPQTVTATFLPFIASNVTAGIQVTLGGYRFNRATGQFAQTVELRNNSGGMLNDVRLVVDGLPGGISLVAPAGSTACAAPAGSAFASAGSIPAGGSAQVQLLFNNPARSAIAYTPRILSGPGQP